MSAVTPGARRITPERSRAVARLTQPREATDPIVDTTFMSVCGAVLLAVLIMSGLLAMGQIRPVPAYALFGSALFGAVFSTFLVAALHLAITDSRRQHDDD
jgi:hypothetical protein